MSSYLIMLPKSSRKEESNIVSTQSHHSLITRLISEYISGDPAIGCALGLKTDTISNSVPTTYRQAI